MYELNKNGDIILIDANPAADKLLQFTHIPFFGQKIEDIFPAIKNTEILSLCHEIILKGRTVQNEELIW